MSIQITVRLDEGLVANLDAVVASGGAKSRAAVIESALEAEFRRRLYQREIDILRTQPSDPDMDALAAWMVGRYPGIE
jgi:Arc/MetJ-type ribon-helix-helix transcriptional regulator